MHQESFWLKILIFAYCLLGAIIIAHFGTKVNRIAKNSWWSLGLPINNLNDEEKKQIKKYGNKAKLYLLALFISFVVVSLIFFRP